MSFSSPILPHDQAAILLDRLIDRVESVIIGKRQEIKMTIIAMLCGGHVLLEDVPGVGKTMLVRTVAACLGCSFGRIQFTPDLMPSDITGTSVYHPRTAEFEFRPGPILSNIVLADEINRATPRTQSALLEAMEERKVTVDGTTHQVPLPFLLLATQNPLQFEGTYRLPEAQLDRFLMRLRIGYPSPAQEVELLNRMQVHSPLDKIKPVLLAEELLAIQRQVRTVFVDDSIKKYLVEVADASRRHPKCALGISPRGTLAWMNAAQAEAYLQGRMYVIPDDAKAVATAVLSHRIALVPEAKIGGLSGEDIVSELTAKIAVPMHRTAARTSL
ncbi:MoxR family ATPase [Paenibacillus sediminis]|uniref:MoxR-like ATPase n=1 Tax=Paenibacillus sediminis TaxID=664909 RepID=A0ABS4H7F1_9BACL|nr:MoxR family ATPase [Paenibacillus sediminis]MBP1937990.1 MoxR-like ATPase [Paenibacillus sediminis]